MRISGERTMLADLTTRGLRQPWQSLTTCCPTFSSPRETKFIRGGSQGCYRWVRISKHRKKPSDIGANSREHSMLHHRTHKIHGQKSANTTHHRGQRACCVLRCVLAVVIQRRSNSCIFIHDCPFFLIAFFVFLPLLLPRKLQIFIQPKADSTLIHKFSE